ncbi:hypothetical protein KIW84_041719 [Lathyrus oleraceus]|uniref:Uncharacterized protein n=1 Tax=Pisum sativum TaxID=3888 RepID=A0A9D4X9C1_PEA|nr:hypothetical protein KIW84_041719 [Pisum sativum]
MQTFTSVSSPSTHILGSTRAFLQVLTSAKLNKRTSMLRLEKIILNVQFEHELNGKSTAAYECYQKAIDIVFTSFTNHNNPHPLQHGEPCTVVNIVSLAANIEVGYESQFRGSKALCNGYSEKLDSTNSYSLLHDESNDHHIERLISKTINIGNDAATTDNGKSSIISDILYLEFDAWDDLEKLLSDGTENQNGPLKKSSSWNVQTNQSRFSFTRQEESKIQAFDMNPSHGANQQLLSSLFIKLQNLKLIWTCKML